MLLTKHHSKFHFSAVLLISLSISLCLAVSTYYINFWPTDSWNAYRPAGKMLFDHPFVSQVHDEVGFKLIMRGKETLILAIALMQRLLGDFESEYPAVLVLILAMNVCSILIFQILKRLLNEKTAFIAFLFFATTSWPYMYVLQAAHPPMVLLLFLAAVYFLQMAEGRKLLIFLSGISLGLMLFSSPTSPIYLPYYVGFWIFFNRGKPLREVGKRMLIQAGLMLAGILIPFLYFTLPDPIAYLHKFQDFLNFSRRGNDFIIWRHLLEQYFSFPESFRGGGIIWVLKYMFLILPILFPLYIASLIYLMVRAFKKKAYFGIILISLSTLILVEVSQVAQFGRNYFSWFIGIIFLIGVAIYDHFYIVKTKSRILAGGIALILMVHVGINAVVFTKEIFPSRLASTFIYEWLIKHQITQISSYREHPLNKNILQFLVNPKAKQPLRLKPIESIVQVPDGYILVQPITGKSVLNACAYGDYDRDPFLTMLYASGEFKKYVVKEFNTLSSSRLWAEEEEVCAYRDLVLGQITSMDREKGKVWILDARKLQQEWVPQVIHRLKK